MLCYRCGGHVKEGSDKCVSCGQQFEPGVKPGPAAGFGAGSRRQRVAIEGAPCSVGDTVGGRFEITGQLGRGPLGWVYRATEASTGNAFALKVLSPRFLQLPEEKRRFIDELRRAQQLSHQNIARIYDAFEDEGRPFVALQLVDGLTLRRIVELRRQKSQGFTLEEVEPIVAQIAAALEAAKGTFAHGDLKPDNVMVLPDLLKLTDFGLAVSLPRAPFMAAQRAAGVQRYLAPEFLLGDPLDARTDVFSLGVIVGDLLTGAGFETQLSLLQKPPALPPAVEALVRRAVSPRPSDRHASAAQFASELSALIVPASSPAAGAQPEDAGDVIIEEVHTHPRFRIERALAAQERAAAPDAPSQPAAAAVAQEKSPAHGQQLPDSPPGLFASSPAMSAGSTEVSAGSPEMSAAAPARSAASDARMSAAAGETQAPAAAAPIAPFAAPPPFEPQGAPSHAAAAHDSRPSRGQPSAHLLEVAARVGATPELLTADTAVRAAPQPPASRGEAAALPAHDTASTDASADSDRPRRGAGKRSKDRHSKPPRPRRSTPPEPAWTSGTAAVASTPATEGALATGPATSALHRLEREITAPVDAIVQAPAAAAPAKPVSRPPRATVTGSFGAPPGPKKRLPIPLLAAGAVALLLGAAGVASLFSSRAAEAPAVAAASVIPPAAASAQSPAKSAARTADIASDVAAQAAGNHAPPEKKATAQRVPVEPPKARADAHKSLREHISAVRESAQKALEERRRKREEAIQQASAHREEGAALASAAAKPASVTAGQAAANSAATAATPSGAAAATPAAPLAAAASGSSVMSAATAAAVSAAAVSGTPVPAAAKPLPPAGAIRGLDDGDSLLATRDRKLVASASAIPASALARGEMACPPGMQRVAGGAAQIGSDAKDDLRNFGDRALATVDVRPYCIDQFEFPNTAGKLPKVAASWSDADASCRNAGKRLCSEEEWEKACKGPQAARFPYGHDFDANACNTQDEKDNPRQVSAVGAFAKCRSGYGVWDMSGNAAEWTASSFDSGPEKAVKGGHAARPGFDDRCASRRKLAPGQHDAKVGFRCCADAH